MAVRLAYWKTIAELHPACEGFRVTVSRLSSRKERLGIARDYIGPECFSRCPIRGVIKAATLGPPGARTGPNGVLEDAPSILFLRRSAPGAGGSDAPNVKGLDLPSTAPAKPERFLGRISHCQRIASATASLSGTFLHSSNWQPALGARY